MILGTIKKQKIGFLNTKQINLATYRWLRITTSMITFFWSPEIDWNTFTSSNIVHNSMTHFFCHIWKGCRLDVYSEGINLDSVLTENCRLLHFSSIILTSQICQIPSCIHWFRYTCPFLTKKGKVVGRLWKEWKTGTHRKHIFATCCHSWG